MRSDEEDEGEGASLGSIYDDPSGEIAPYRSGARPFAGRKSYAALWMDAERELGRDLADAVEAAMRLMGSLRDAPDRDLLRRRIAGEEAAAAMSWAADDGRRDAVLREAAGVGAGGLGREGGICVANARLLIEAGALSLPEDIETLVERAAPRHGYGGDEEELSVFVSTPDEWREALTEWLVEIKEIEPPVHWLTRSCAIYATWPTGSLAEEAGSLEALGVASRSAHAHCRELGFLPVCRAGQRRRPLMRVRQPHEALRLWLGWAAASAKEYEMEIGRWRDWRHRVSEAFLARRGKRGPGTALGIADIAVRQGYFTSQMVAEELRCSESMVRTVASEMHRMGLLVDEERSRRLHVWKPKL